MERLVNLEEVGERLGGVCIKTVRRLIAAGELPPVVKVGARSTLPESEVCAYVERLKGQRRTTV